MRRWFVVVAQNNATPAGMIYYRTGSLPPIEIDKPLIFDLEISIFEPGPPYWIDKSR